MVPLACDRTSRKGVFYFVSKRFIAALTIFALIISILPFYSVQAEGNLEFSAPLAGQNWVMGNNYEIRFSKSASSSTNYVQLSLIDTNETVRGIMTTLTLEPNVTSGSYLWSIPLESNTEMVISPGSSYRVKAVVQGGSGSEVFRSGLFTISANTLMAPDLAVTAIRLGAWSPNGFYEVQLRQDWVKALEFTVKNIGATTASGNIGTLASVGGVSPSTPCDGVIGNLTLAPNESEKYVCYFVDTPIPLGEVNASVSISAAAQELVFSNNTLVRPFTILSPATASSVTISNTGTVPSSIIVAPGQTGVSLAQFKVKATSTESIRASRIVFYTDEQPVKHLKNLKLHSGNRTLSADLQAQTWYGTNIVFNDVNIVIPAGQEITVTLKGDISAESMLTAQSSVELVRYGTSRFINVSSEQDVEIQGQNVKTDFTILSLAPETPLIQSYGASSIRGTSATIIWKTSRPATSHLTITTTDPDIIKENSTLKTEHSFTVSSLKPNTEYSYIITGRSGELEVPLAYGNFKTTKDTATGDTSNQPEHVKKEKEQVRKVDKDLVKQVSGKLFLQVESKGEAWYVAPNDGKKYYLPDGASAYDALRKFGIGITNNDLKKIPVGEPSYKLIDNDRDGLDDKTEESLGSDPNKSDSDGDGYKDGTEVYAGYDPLSKGKLPQDRNFTTRMKGKIFIQVQGKGEAWYVNPSDGKRYFLADADTAYEMMRRLSTGITNENLRKIGVGDL